MDESTPNRSVSGHAANLFDVLSAAAETFLANHPAVVAARTATGAHAPTVLPAATGPLARTWDQLALERGLLRRCHIPLRRSPASFSLAPRLSAPRRLRLPLRLDTLDMPDVVLCPKHGNTRVASGSSSEAWSGGLLPLAVPVIPELSDTR